MTNGTFIAYDPATGDELKEPPALTAIIAYERDGAPLNADEEGTLRLSVVSAEPNQVTDGHWAVKWVTAVDVKSVGENWVLHLEGAQNVDVDRSTFESGASPNCHMASWTDDKAQEWVGIPLWALVGFVDDEIKHEGPAFNDALADAGYSVEIIASDGYTVTMESACVKRNDNIIVAITANGNPLPEKYYPLRLVGSDLAKNEMTGAITTIKVRCLRWLALERHRQDQPLSPSWWSLATPSKPWSSWKTSFVRWKWSRSAPRTPRKAPLLTTKVC